MWWLKADGPGWCWSLGQVHPDASSTWEFWTRSSGIFGNIFSSEKKVSSEKNVSWCEFYSIPFCSPSTHQSSLTASSLCVAFVQNTYRQTRPFDLFDVRARNQNNQNNAHERLMWLIRPAQPEQEHERMPSSPRTHEHYLSTSIMHKQLRTHTHALELHSHVTSPWGF